MCYYDVSDIVKELGGMFFHHTSMMTTLQASVVTIGCVMAAGDAYLSVPAIAGAGHNLSCSCYVLAAWTVLQALYLVQITVLHNRMPMPDH